jgi:hypothetical protein
MAVAIPLVAAVAGGTASAFDARSLLLAGVVVLGWSQLVGLWGESLLGALAPLGKVAGKKASWLAQVALYTLAGAASSLFVGGTLGAAGALLVPGLARTVGVPAVLGLALVATTRELGWVRFPLPQPRRQTKDIWGKIFSPPVAATLWGLDLGLLVTTRLTFSGTWLLILLPLLMQDAMLGALLLLAYWLGRALVIWIAPLLFEDASSTPRVLEEINDHYRLFQLVHVVGLGLVIAFLASSLA